MFQIINEIVYAFVYQFFSKAVNDDFTLTILSSFYILGTALIALRIVITIGYQSYYSLFQIGAKDIKSLKELKETPSRLLNKIIKEYIKTAERGVQGLNAQAIANKHISKLKFFIFRYKSMEAFISQFEISIVFIGILMALFLDYSEVFAVSSIAMHCFMRLLSLFFNFTAVRESLENEITIYAEREIGQFYSVNLATAVQSLKLELKNSIQAQSKSLNDSIAKLCSDIPEALKLALPVSEWSSSLNNAKELQTSVNSSVKELHGAAERLKDSMSALDKTFAAQNEYLIMHKESVHAEINELSEITKSLEPSSSALQSGLNYIKQNQALLEKSVQSYELALENMTAKIGQGIGSIMNYNVEAAYKNLDASILENIGKIIQSNNEFYIRLQKLFDEMFEQSRNETQAIISLKEQMDMHFEELFESRK